WSGRDVLVILLVIGALQALAGCFAGALGRFCERQGYREESVLLILETIILHVAGFVTVLVLLRKNRVSWDSAFGFRLSGLGKRVGQGALCLLATMPPLLFYTWIYHLVLQFAGFDAAPQDVLFAISEETSMAMRIFFIVLAAVLAPFFEEVLFRGILLPFLAQRLRLGVAIGIVSVLFALMHWNVASFVPLFVLSVAFSLVYIYTESLLASMVMHSMFNLVTISLLLSVR
ncbi:MAG TPA: type II CAAX endopeptidase family protein, partial [Kiritimatiellia bacterium]